MVGEAVKEAREFRHFTQKMVSNLGFCSDKTVSAVESGKRSAGIDILENITRSLDYPRLYMEAVEAITGGAYSSPWLDGEEVDLYRTSVWAKTIEELYEAQMSLKETKLINKRTDEITKIQILESMLQALDARVAIDHYVAVICDEYGYSVREVFETHRKKLESRGYIKPRIKKESAYECTHK